MPLPETCEHDTRIGQPCWRCSEAVRRGCTGCQALPYARACLEHTCPDCGMATWSSVEVHGRVCRGS